MYEEKKPGMTKPVEKSSEVWYNMTINAQGLSYQELNHQVRAAGDCTITGCMGQRFIASGMKDKAITIQGVPGNALGAYLNGAEITVLGNAQDAVGDTMNAGKIVVHGSIGDAAGYAMRGGVILVRDNAGYRAGIHMKEYQDKQPKMIIGGRTGSFLGEYQAGGVILVLGLHTDGKPIVGNFPCTGMHGGKMYLRGACDDVTFPERVQIRPASQEEKTEISAYVAEYCRSFGGDPQAIMDAPFTTVTPDSKNPYKQMYVTN